MKRRLLLVWLLALSTLCSFAQQSVQGTPRPGIQSRAEQAQITANVDFRSIAYWVGNGDYSTALVVKWDDGKGGNTNLVWGYRFNAGATGIDMLRDVAAADPRFYMLVYGNSPYGAAIGGLGYDLNSNGSILLKSGNNTYSLTEGVYDFGGYGFDGFVSNDSLDHWRAGWMNGYWSYWTTNRSDSIYKYSNVGASSRQLVDGGIDGWSYMSDMSSFYTNDMSGTLEYVSEPSPYSNIQRQTRTVTEKAEPQKWTAYNLAQFREYVSTAEDGDVVEFYVGMRGTEIEENLGLGNIEKSLTLVGNGVVLKGGTETIKSTASSSEVNRKLTIRDFVFKDFSTVPLFVQNVSLNIEKCVFDGNISSKTGGGGINTHATSGTSPVTINVIGCRFSNNQSNDKICPGSCLSLWNNIKKELFSANIVSCTFVDNTAKLGSVISLTNAQNLNLVNNVFQNNGSGSIIDFYKTSAASVEELGSRGYNIFAGDFSASEVSRLTDTDIQGTDLAASLTLVDGEYQVVKGGLAYEHLPANPAVEGITFPEHDVMGTIIDYSRPTHSGACQMVYEEGASVDYTQGVFFVNEDWYGHQNSTVNFLTNDGEWIYRVVQKENPGVELGCTNQYGAIYGDRFYLIAKQDKDPGASIAGGRLTICDAKTMKVLKQFANISVDGNGNSNADGRGFLGVDEHKGYVGTSNGIYVLDLDELELRGVVTGSENNQLYDGEVGNMVRVGDRVFAVHRDKGLLVINPATDQVEQVIEGIDGWGFGSVVLSKDGNLWLSLASTSGSGAADTRIMKVSPYTLQTEVINLPEGIYGPANSWYAWTPDCFCASQQQNVLYWNGGNSSWFSGYTVYKYDIDKNEFSTYIDYNGDPDGWQIYGCSFRVSPEGDEAYVSLFKGFGDPTYVVRKYDADGHQLAEYPMIQNYWFPSLPVFPDNAEPVVTNPDAVNMTLDAPVKVSLENIATDADNMDAAIVKTVKSVSDESVLKAEIQNGDLVVTPLSEGNATVTLGINSNGKLAEASVDITVTGGTGIEMAGEDMQPKLHYSVDGKRVDASQRGLHVIRMQNGHTRKIVVR